MSGVAGLVLLLAAGLAVYEAALVWHTVRTLTRPPRRGYSYAVARGLPGDPSELATPARFTTWTFQSPAVPGPLEVWDIEGGNPTGPVVIVTHGWGESRVFALARVPALLPLASRIILWDLPGHGDAPGICRLGTAEVDVLRSLIGRLGADPPLVLYGSSLGAGVSIAAAVESTAGPVVAVIAEAPYRFPIVPALNVMEGAAIPHRINLPIALGVLGSRFGHGLSWMRGSTAARFDRAALASTLTVPLLVLHGVEDRICPIADGRTIAAAAQRGCIVEINGGGHMDLWFPPFADRSAAAVTEFLRGVAPLGAADPTQSVQNEPRTK